MQQDLAGRYALVTGAGAGIGKATALTLAARGAIVGVNDLRDELVTGTVEAVVATGGHAFPVVKNVSTRQGVTEAVNTVCEKGGRFDILINNAAWVRYQPVQDIAPETMRHQSKAFEQTCIYYFRGRLDGWKIQKACTIA
ncbi:SDR family NAD(P)-dependent oxidoreductase [Paraburkholderia tropica]|uniref:SDR family NAD(P)-dependent oxidoreductase n=1 Tax=Paraburkholderia tropica TaxID=92647 RepID=UPI000AFE5C0A|nr:SDR family oxidoreductase [Paraburkholderia tropica]MBB2979874.1 NAD(P)-dependent dehydrogenase (short-subunit alcohol dehydrogenase family) [Paraburkholderia tropica]